MKTPATRVALLWLVTSACGPQARPVVVTLSPGPTAASTSAAGSTIPDPSFPLSCAAALPRFAFPAPPPGDRTPTAGQMTEEAAQAKRLFDRERWDEAVNAMGRIASGDTGDDEGNKQLAAYHRAVALYHAGHAADSAAAFLDIAGRPAHIKHPETLLWLVKLAPDAPVVVRGMAHYDAASAARLDNSNQQDTYQGALFLLARERFERGEKPEARDLFSRVDPSSRWFPLAHRCLDALGAR